MELKYLSYSGVILCLLINAFGLFWFCVIVLSLIGFLLGCVCVFCVSFFGKSLKFHLLFLRTHRILSVLYLHHGNVDEYLQKTNQGNPLDDIKPLGLHLGMRNPFQFSINLNIYRQLKLSLCNQLRQRRVTISMLTHWRCYIGH